MSETDRTVLGGGRIVTPNETIRDGGLTVVGDRIASVDRDPDEQPDVDTSDRLVVPGIVDLHGDDIERHLFPRAEDRVQPDRAIERCDQATIAAGITTKCHALSFEDSPDDNRSLDLTKRVADAIRSFDERGRARAEHRLHLRCELTSAGSVDAVRDRLDGPAVALASLVRHVPGEGQFDSPEEYAKRFDGGESTTADRVADVAQQRAAVPERTVRARTRRLLSAASESAVPVAVHDSTDPERVRQHAADGVDICEFPVTLSAARTASTSGLWTAMGAPNVLRGGSMWDNLSARRAIRAGVVDVLCSDFRPGALLASCFVETGEPLHERVSRVTAAPARAIGLDDRGRIEPGARADLVVVDPDPEPRVVRAFVAGTEVYRTEPRPTGC
jgi:alpha-D-ribose 1-methylphosphonate 5-triphosphate diphosphatase